jgi:hypothetical protein
MTTHNWSQYHQRVDVLTKELAIQSKSLTIFLKLAKAKKQIIICHSCHSACQERKFKTHGFRFLISQIHLLKRKMHEGMDFTAKVGNLILQLATELWHKQTATSWLWESYCP